LVAYIFTLYSTGWNPLWKIYQNLYLEVSMILSLQMVQIEQMVNETLVVDGN